MFQVNYMNIEKLFQDNQLIKMGHKACENKVLRFIKFGYKLICSDSALYQIIPTVIEVILTKKYDLSFVWAEKNY